MREVFRNLFSILIFKRGCAVCQKGNARLCSNCIEYLKSTSSVKLHFGRLYLWNNRAVAKLYYLKNRDVYNNLKRLVDKKIRDLSFYERGIFNPFKTNKKEGNSFIKRLNIRKYLNF